MSVVFIGHLMGGEGVYMCEEGGWREGVYMCEEGGWREGVYMCEEGGCVYMCEEGGMCICVRREGGERWGEEGAEYLVV